MCAWNLAAKLEKCNNTTADRRRRYLHNSCQLLQVVPCAQWLLQSHQMVPLMLLWRAVRSGAICWNTPVQPLVIRCRIKEALKVLSAEFSGIDHVPHLQFTCYLDVPPTPHPPPFVLPLFLSPSFCPNLSHFHLHVPSYCPPQFCRSVLRPLSFFLSISRP